MIIVVAKFYDLNKIWFYFSRILMLLNKRQLEKLKEDWWKSDEYQSKCEKPEDQSDGISIQNIGGVFIVIFVGIGMACITLVFEYWYYKYRKNPQVIDVAEATSKIDRHHNMVGGGKHDSVMIGGGAVGGGSATEMGSGDALHPAKGSFFKSTMLRSRINQAPVALKPKFQI